MPSTRLVSCGSWRRMERPSVTVLLCLRCGSVSASTSVSLLEFFLSGETRRQGTQSSSLSGFGRGEKMRADRRCIKVLTKIRFAQVITDEVYNILETEGGLKRKEVVLEDGNRKERPRSFVFVSPGFQEKERLQVASKSCKVHFYSFISGADPRIGCGEGWPVDSQAHYKRGFGSRQCPSLPQVQPPTNLYILHLYPLTGRRRRKIGGLL